MAANIFQPHDLLSLLGAGLALVAIYLILQNGQVANQIFGTVIGGVNTGFKTLQGR